MQTAYLIAFYDTRTKTIARIKIASAWPVSQMDLGVVHQLLITSVKGLDVPRSAPNTQGDDPTSTSPMDLGIPTARPRTVRK